MLKEKLNELLEEPAYQHTGEDYFSGVCSAENILDEVIDHFINGTEIEQDDFEL